MTRRRRLDALEARQTARPASQHEDPERVRVVEELRALFHALPEVLRLDVLARGGVRGPAELLEGAWMIGQRGEGESLEGYALRAFRAVFTPGAVA